MQLKQIITTISGITLDGETYRLQPLNLVNESKMTFPRTNATEYRKQRNTWTLPSKVRRNGVICCCGLTRNFHKCFTVRSLCDNHYARVCCFNKKQSAVKKSEKSLQRDRARMSAFVFRKTAENSLPFFHADEHSIREMQFNSAKMTVDV